MATGMQVWSQTPVTNATADNNVNWAEGMAPSQVDDSARGMMASAAKWVADNSGSLVTSGTTTALTLVTNQVESALTTGYTVTATLGTAVAAAATLAVDGLAAAPIFTSLSSGSAISTGSLALGNVSSFVYTTAITGTASAWVVKAVSPSAVSAIPVLTVLTNSLSGDVTLNNGGAYVDGPSIAAGSTGVWYVSGTVTCYNSGGSANFNIKLWDSTAVIASSRLNYQVATASLPASLSGFITNPTSNLKISGVSDSNGSSFKFNTSGNSKDSTITAIRVG